MSCALSTMGSILPCDATGHPGPSGGGPPHGVKAVIGKRPKMEDAFFCSTNFIAVPSSSNEHNEEKLPARIAMQLRRTSNPGSEADAALSPLMSPSGRSFPDPHTLGSDATEEPLESLHFFAVYDGHGGAQAANHCAARLHQHLSEALANVHPHSAAGGAGARHPVGPRPAPIPEDEQEAATASSDPSASSDSAPALMNTAVAAAAAMLDAATIDDGAGAGAEDGSGAASAPEVSLRSEVSGGSSGGGVSECSAPPHDPHRVLRDDEFVEDALRDAFLKTDEEFASDCCASMVGSTAVVALLGKKRIWVANCGARCDDPCSVLLAHPPINLPPSPTPAATPPPLPLPRHLQFILLPGGTLAEELPVTPCHSLSLPVTPCRSLPLTPSWPLTSPQGTLALSCAGRAGASSSQTITSRSGRTRRWVSHVALSPCERAAPSNTPCI